MSSGSFSSRSCAKPVGRCRDCVIAHGRRDPPRVSVVAEPEQKVQRRVRVHQARRGARPRLIPKLAAATAGGGCGNGRHSSCNCVPGRCIVVEFPAFYLINTYVPNSGITLDSESRREAWDANLSAHLHTLSPVCMPSRDHASLGVAIDLMARCGPDVVQKGGDMNVAPEDLDASHPDFFATQGIHGQPGCVACSMHALFYPIHQPIPSHPILSQHDTWRAPALQTDPQHTRAGRHVWRLLRLDKYMMMAADSAICMQACRDSRGSHGRASVCDELPVHRITHAHRQVCWQGNAA